MTRLIIIEDHPIVIDGLKNLFYNYPEIEMIASYNTGAEAMQALQTLAVDVILLDINLPDINGINLCKEIKSKFGAINIIALSLHNEHAVIRSMLQNGALGYVLKNAAGEEIIEAIQEVSNGRQYLCTATKKSLENSASEKLKTVPLITRREREVLELVGKGLTTQQVADKLFISAHTVESHRKKLMEKFNVNNIISVIKMASDYHLL